MSQELRPFLQEETFSNKRGAVWASVVSSLLSKASGKYPWVVSDGRLLCPTGAFYVNVPAPSALYAVKVAGQRLEEDSKLPLQVVVNSCGVYSLKGRKLADWVSWSSLPSSEQAALERLMARLPGGVSEDLLYCPAQERYPVVLSPHDVEKINISSAFLCGRLLVLFSAHFLVAIVLDTTFPSSRRHVPSADFRRFSLEQWREGLAPIPTAAVPVLLELQRHKVGFSLSAKICRSTGRMATLEFLRGSSSLVFYTDTVCDDQVEIVSALLAAAFNAENYSRRVPLSLNVIRCLQNLQKTSWNASLCASRGGLLDDRVLVLYSAAKQWEIAQLSAAKARLQSHPVHPSCGCVYLAKLVAKLLGGNYSSWEVSSSNSHGPIAFYPLVCAGTALVLVSPRLVAIQDKQKADGVTAALQPTWA